MPPTNRLALITGPTSGIGKITAIELAKRNFDLILVARNPQKVAELQRELGNHVQTDFVECDLARLSSVREAVAKIKARYSKLDVLINNAGLMMDHLEISPDGVEMTFATNHLGPFLLTTELLDLLKAGDQARIVHVSSEAHRFGTFRIDQLAQPATFSSWGTYGNSKLANILFSNALAERLQPFGITSNALHPGGVATNFAGQSTGLVNLTMKLIRPFFKTPEEGAQMTIYLASSPEVEGVTGKYFSDLKQKKPHKDAQSSFLANKLWALSEELTRN
ncbi:SDR family oxidoreductase [Rhabdobacter roseus]|uniref:NAD(P)-dependent dehydrogenase (Short-subunit alcohol dehydrogenase family) n=1 Tax=Rhabdobacter roseus TaxID=1655419 RepID=A0A840TNC3_9BACT|nr:SDR family oxidoreductase [Rhabdobacter roseus]MBB5285776.1 NAD(P)-dependent dehydrogenase (short-subunit alcohol dehydrogenase family) [Rhabdobacter roseus]